MKYFLHDTSAFDDEKISELFINFGYEGIGLFFTILEKIAKQEKPVKTSVLKHQLKVGKRLNKCWMFLENIDLISSNNGYSWASLFDKNYQHERLAYKSPKEWNKIRVIVFERDNYICQYCGSELFIECDHIIPFSKGGDETLTNLKTSCRKCNRRKKDKSVETFLKSEIR